MAWGIMMTAVTLVGMLGLLMFNTAQQLSSIPSEDTHPVALASLQQKRAA